jgi:hypothetical protein
MIADLVLVNGRIHTFDSALPRATALAVWQGRILYLGDDATARGLLGRGGELVDLRGACVLPGLTDGHMHLRWFGAQLSSADAETPTLAQAVARVAAFAQRTPAGQWIRGRGWNHNVWGGAFPTADDLDAVTPDHPVTLGAKSGHAAWLNSAALRLAGITSETADPPGGRIVRDAAGHPTGILLEEAMALVEPLLPTSSLEQIVAETRQALAAAARLGLTSLHDMDGPDSLRALQVLAERDELPLRVVKSIPLDQLDAAIALGVRTGLGSDRLRLGQCKLFADGALGPRTAWMLEGYASAPENTGIATTPMGTIRQAVLRANAAGIGCAVHAIGDRACREVLDVYAEARAEARASAPAPRNRIEHLQILAPQDWDRPAELGVIASMQPIHATSDMDISDRHLGQRAANAYVFRSLLDRGTVLCFGSDCPVETIDPLVGIHAAVTRRRRDGSPGPEGWHGEQRLTVAEAIRGFTWGPAYAAGLEQRLGTIAAGKWADLTILEHDPLAIDPMKLPDAGVLGTLVGGQFAWRHDSLS